MKNRFFSQGFFIGVLITFFVIGLNFIKVDSVQQLLQRVEGILYDTRLMLTLPTQKRQFDEKVVIIDIDEKSMREQGRYPWSRRKVSVLVNKLMDAGVVVVAFDIFFSEPELNPIDQIVANNTSLKEQDREYLSTFKRSVDADSTFSQTLGQSEVVLGFLFDNNAKTAGQLPARVINWQLPPGLHSEIPTYQHVLSNIPTLQSTAIGSGFINSVPESDGFIRKASLVINYQGQLYPSLALEAARVYTLVDEIDAISKETDHTQWLQGLTFGKRFIPTNEKGQIFIPYKGRKHSFDYISATDVLNDRIEGDELEGAIAFIGTSAVGLADLRTTSVGVQYPGVEVHANVFEGLIHPEILPVELDITLAIVFSLLICTGVILSSLMVNQGPLHIFSYCLISILFHLTLNGYCWSVLKVSLPIFQVLLLIALLTTYYGSFGFMLENSKRKKIKNMFDQYVPPAYIEKLINASEGGKLKTERKELSVLFADIRNFTQLSEHFTPDELSDFLNEYLTEATAIIFQHKGTIDKYVGDMVMAIWNAPLSDKYHAKHSVVTALALTELTKELTVKFTERGWPEIALGIGISTGDMVVGDMGSQYRKAYTVLGDAVNLGARIESLTRFYHVDILITENTFQEIKAQGLQCRHIDRIQVKGKLQAVNIYQPIALEERLSPADKEELLSHQLAMRAYFNGEWKKAEELFLTLQQSQFLSTKVYSVYLERLPFLIKNSGIDDWNGVYRHKNK